MKTISPILILLVTLFSNNLTAQTCDTLNGEVPVRIEIFADNHPEEIYWEVHDMSVGGLVASDTCVSPLTLHTRDFCVSDANCYGFYLTDWGGNGLCCDSGNGYWQLYYDGILQVSGAQFAWLDSVLFGDCCSDNSDCDDGDLCTTDICYIGGCNNSMLNCNDADGCTIDTCINGVCAALVCSDGSACTIDTCLGGQCQFLPLSTAPEICIVGVDSVTGKNILVWEKPVSSVIDSYIIYRETNQTETYAAFGAQAYGDFSTFIDLQSIPEQNSNRYKLGLVDVCGDTLISAGYHKTIHLSINQGVGNSWNLNWNAYEGFPFTTYNIYRGTTSANLTLLNSIASNLDSYTDLNPPATSTIYYQIEVTNGNTCNPTAKMGSYDASRSNVVSTPLVGIGQVDNTNLLKMYPNPFSSSITIEMPAPADGPFDIIISDVTGRKLLEEQNISAAVFILNRPAYMQGIFYVELRGVKHIYRGKIIAIQ